MLAEYNQRAHEALPGLPDSIVSGHVAVFSDGGTVCVSDRRPPDMTISICLTPPNCFYKGGGRLQLTQYDKVNRSSRLYDVVARSELEAQLLSILRWATFEDSDSEEIRDRIVSFVESDEYLNHYRKNEAELQKLQEAQLIMGEADRQLVSQALNLKGDVRRQAIRELPNARSLHQFVLNINPNDGLLDFLGVADHPHCDQGTAHYIYWQLADLVHSPELRAKSAVKKPEWNGAAILDLIEHRLRGERFASARIHFDPANTVPLNRLQLHQLRRQGVSEELLAPVGDCAMEREWLL